VFIKRTKVKRKKFFLGGSTEGVTVSSEAKGLSDLNMPEQVFRGSVMRGSLRRGSLMRGSLMRGSFKGNSFGELFARTLWGN
jgi:hypothetical protein